MIKNLPVTIEIVFILTTFLTVFLFYKAARNSLSVILILLSWLLLQGILAVIGFYGYDIINAHHGFSYNIGPSGFISKNNFPPRMILLVLVPFLSIIGLFLSKRGRNFIDNLDIKMLTILHIVRIPVEMVLYCLFLNKAVPELMTFEGRNFDIIAGLSAPLIFYYGFIKSVLSRRILIFWNIVCLGLLFNILVNAVLSAPFRFQQFAFDQPNIAVFYFPFVWLPGCIVPLVILSHLVTLRKLFLTEVDINRN